MSQPANSPTGTPRAAAVAGELVSLLEADVDGLRPADRVRGRWERIAAALTSTASRPRPRRTH